MADEDLWSLLVGVQDVMRTGQLVPFLPVQEGHAHHSRWEASRNEIMQPCNMFFIILFFFK